MTTNVPTTVLELPLQLEEMLPEEVNIQKRFKTKLKIQAGLDAIVEMQTAVLTALKSDSIDKNERKRFETAKAAIVEARESVEESTLDARSLDLEQHPIGAVIPKMAKDEMSDLRRSMEENGYFPEEPIILFEGMILDGWHRYQTAARVGVTPTFKDYKGDDPVGYVAARNVQGRRHLNEDQRSIAAGELAEIQAERGGVGEASKHAAKAAHITANRVARARRLLKVSTPLAEAVRSGELSLIDAEKISHTDELVQMLDDGYDGNVSDLIPDVHPQTAAQVKKAHLPLDVWNHEDVVYDAEGNALGEGYWREPEPEPEPLTDDEVDAVIAEVRANTDDPTKRNSIRRALRARKDHEVDAIYAAFLGVEPEDMERGKITSAVVAQLIDFFADEGEVADEEE